MGDVLEDIGGYIVDGINELLAESGAWAESLLNSGTKLYNRLIDAAYKLLVRDIEDDSFEQFWDIVSFMNNVLVAIATTLLAIFFVYGLVQASIDTRQDVNMFGLVKDFIKLALCEALVTFSLDIAVYIFRFGTTLASAAVGSISKQEFVLTDPDRGLSNNISTALVKGGVSGISGFLATILCFFGAIVICGCGIMIVMEIFKRFFKIFCLIPFASISFSTAVMSDGHGNEVFRGYLKSLIACSLESVVIVLCMAFCASLTTYEVGDNSFMGSVFTLVENDSQRIVTIATEEEYEQFREFSRKMKKKPSTIEMGVPINSGYEEALLNYKKSILDEYPQFSECGIFDYTKIISGGPTEVELAEDEMTELQKYWASLGHTVYDTAYNFPVKILIGNEISLGSALMFVLQAIFPMILTAGAVKEAPGYCSKILGL